MSKNFNIELKSQKNKILIMALCITVLCILAFSITASAAKEGYYTYRVTNGEATITDCDTSISGDVIIPSTLGGYPVTSIGYMAFYECISLTSITIPNGVKSIGIQAFYNCYSLTSITIPNGVTSIGWHAFYNCKSLTSITIPNSVKGIGESAFSSCKSLTSITIPDSVTSIRTGAFTLCKSLKSITVDENNNYYSSIDGNLFNKSKTELIQYAIGKTDSTYRIPDSVTSIGRNAFSYCTNLKSITIPDSVTSIGDCAFFDCKSLTSVTISNSVTSIGSGAFSDCSSLTSITIPNGVTSIGYGAFEYCSSLTDVYYSGSEEDWANISIGSDNSVLTNATIHYNYLPPIDYEYHLPEEKSGQFSFASSNFASGRASGNFVYKDYYFNGEADSYNHDLAKTSLDLAVSAFATKNIKTQYENAEALLKKMGFVAEGIKHNDWYEKEPVQNSIAVIAGRKHITYSDGNYTLIAVAIRGQGYKSEWGGNFNVGTDEDHAGFTEARKQVVEFIKWYINNQRIGGNIKLWITGYSRAAATANLTAAYLDENPDALGSWVTLTPESIYAYCFETPAGTRAANMNDSLYNNIFSILNRHDPVPMVVMNRWNYGRYGITKYLPSALTTSNYGKMATRMKLYYEDYANKSHYDYVIDDFASYELYFKEGYDWLLDYSVGVRKTEVNRYPKNQWMFLDEVVINNLSAAAQNPQTYTELYQADLVSFGEKIIGKEKAKALGKDILAAIQKKKSLYIFGGVLSIGNPVGAFGTGLSAYYAMRGIIKDSLAKYDVTMSDETLDMVVEFLLSLSPGQLCTLLNNLEGLGQAHEPEICLAWMDTIDGSLLTDSDADIIDEYKMRYAIINCPVDVEVYDSNDNLVAAVYGNIPQEIEGSAIVSYIDENGQKIICLPYDEEYRIEVIATDDGEVTYSVHEQDIETGSTKVINYNNIVVKKNDTLTGTAENLTTTEVATYALTSTNVEVAEAEIIEEAKPVTLELTTEGNGVTSNGGEYYKGEFAEIVATPAENEEFLGWYNGEQLISESASYRFQVTEASTLTAKFTENTCYIIISETSGEIISVGRTIKGSSFTLTEELEKYGHTFDGLYTDSTLETELTEETVFSEDTTIYVKWIKNIDITNALYSDNTVSVNALMIDNLVEKSGVVFIALYNGEKLTAIDCIAPSQTINHTFENVAENEESYTVKIMYWNNMTNLMPLNKCESTFVLK